MMTVPLFELVEYYQVCRRQNMWSDMLEMDLIYIILDWN